MHTDLKQFNLTGFIVLGDVFCSIFRFILLKLLNKDSTAHR
jgi:hypothetical protein